ncbi:MAG TPA: glutamate synthase subunit beta, partial [Gemmatimonadaceae bacterium]|nr:glutamate synthase subunit beta [Gemmatimonadaceae bacterium]
GHAVVVFEKADRVGGLLRYGVPDFKLEKSVLDQRLAQLSAEGVVFRTGVNVGEHVGADELRCEFDAVLLAGGAEAARTLDIPGSTLGGIHLAMDYLIQQNRRLAGEVFDEQMIINARGKRVIIIGGGDTGADCAGTALRQGARSVQQFVLAAQPSASRDASTPWPLWPMQLRTSHAHEEGCSREWSVSTTRFSGKNGRVEHLHAIRLETRAIADGPSRVAPMPGTEFSLRADLVLVAIGFAGPIESALLDRLGVTRTADGLVATDTAHRTSVPGVFAAGDMRRGASLVVWAIREGRDAAHAIDQELRASVARTC